MGFTIIGLSFFTPLAFFSFIIANHYKDDKKKHHASKAMYSLGYSSAFVIFIMLCDVFRYQYHSYRTNINTTGQSHELQSYVTQSVSAQEEHTV